MRVSALEQAVQPGGRSPAEAMPAPSESGLSVVEQLISALENLGYASHQAEKVAVSAAREAGEDASLENLIRVALRSLAT